MTPTGPQTRWLYQDAGPDSKGKRGRDIAMTTLKIIYVGYYDDMGRATEKVEVRGTFSPWGPIKPEDRGKLLVRRFHLNSTSSGGQFASYGKPFLVELGEVRDIHTEEVPE